MNETTFTRSFMQGWLKKTKQTLLYHKIADPTWGSDVTGTRFVDVIASFDGRFIGMEWKLTNNHQGFSFSHIRPNQIKTLCDLDDSGASAFLMIGRYVSRTDKDVFAIPPVVWLQRISNIPKKSVRLDDVFSDCKVPRCGASYNYLWLEDQIRDIGWLEPWAKYDREKDQS